MLSFFYVKISLMIYSSSLTCIVCMNTSSRSSTYSSCGAQQIFPELLVGGVRFDERPLFLGEFIAWLLTVGGRDGGAVRVW